MLLCNFEYIFGYMGQRGRPRKYETDEKRAEARRVTQLRYKSNKNGDGKCYYGKKHLINNKDGITIKVETLNRLCVNVVDMEWCITVLYTEDVDLFTELRKSVQVSINKWLEGQSDWDHKNRIFVWENPEYKVKGAYTPVYQYLTFQLYLRRVSETKVWTETLEELLPLVDTLVETIKNTCHEVGITVKYRDNPNNYKHQQKLANNTSTSATEPDAS